MEVVLVTGGSGYIGSHCIVELLEAGYDVVAVDNLMNSKSGSLTRAKSITNKKITFYNVDLNEPEPINKIFTKHKISKVIHFSGSKNVGESISDPFLYFKNNLTSTLNLIEAMQRHEVYQLVFSSSCSVYGDAETFPIKESHPTGAVTSPYGRSKYFIEEILKDIGKAETRWNVASLRYFNPIGAHKSGKLGEDNTRPYTNLIPLISQVAIGKRPKLTVFGDDYDTKDGTAVRDYIHVVDLVKGHVMALKKLDECHLGFKAYNLGLGQGLTVLEIVKAFEDSSGKVVKCEIAPRRIGDVPRLVCDATLAKKELGWVPQCSVKEMCDDFWRWQTMNPNGYSNEENFESSSL